jgi:hypothetical protein
MGITIHYSFVRKKSPKDLLRKAKKLAVKLNWKVLEDNIKNNELELHPHPDCESVELKFKQLKEVREIEGYDYIKNILDDFKFNDKWDNKLWVCTMFCKTQYARIKTHIEVAEFLRVVSSYCYMSRVSDEGDYFEQGFSKKAIEDLKKDFDSSSKMISMLSGQLKEAFGKDKVICGGDL